MPRSIFSKLGLFSLWLVVALGVSSCMNKSDFTVKLPGIKGDTIQMDYVFDGFGCTGNNISPEITWEKAPEGTKSFGVTVFDPDAPTGSGWWHWQVYNIPADRTGLPEGWSTTKEMKQAFQVRNDYGSNLYGGPCPPPGSPHRYEFTVYALKVEKIQLPPGASAAAVGFNLKANALAESTVTKKFGR